jgi:hypothetical protein
MNSKKPIFRLGKMLPSVLKGCLLAWVLTVGLSPVASAADASFVNNAVVNYPLYLANPPVIDATNVINNNTIIINFTTLSLLTPPYYETSDTLNYTNNGLIMGNRGFQFDNQNGTTGVRKPSGVFYNQGTVSSGSTNNTGDPFAGILYVYSLGLGSSYLNAYFPQCLVSATNLISHGQIVSGVNGKVQLSGQRVDLTYGAIVMESDGASNSVSAVSDINVNTNYWNPGAFTATNAHSSILNVSPYMLILTNSTAYFDQVSNGSNSVIRAVFIQDTSKSGVSSSVYFGANGIGSGSATIQWAGSYIDSATGEYRTNYLYLNNDYLESASTNAFVSFLTGVPYNFTFTQSATPLLFSNQAPAGFVSLLPVGAVTNRYSYVDASLTSSTVSTNSLADRAITNLPGRVEISADKELDLSFSRITGCNFLSLVSTNQFDGSAGATITAAYSDFNLGVTNGFMVVSNLITSSIANWSGNVRAWSTRWVAVDPTTGMTNDYRVLIVGSELQPLQPAVVQNLVLHATNSTIISDTLNVLDTVAIDSRNLTLTTNLIGTGAASVDGELNVGNPNMFWSTTLPNLNNLTNNGAIRLVNANQFWGTSNVYTIVAPIASVAATGTLAEVAGHANVSAGTKVFTGGKTYYFSNSLNNATATYQVKIGTTFDGTMSNLIAAINQGAGAGTVYSSSIVANPQVTAGLLTNHAVVISAVTNGTAGNGIQLATTSTDLICNGTASNVMLSGGVDYVAGSTNLVSTATVPYANFINNGLLADQGSSVLANNFAGSGMVSNGVGSFTLTSQTTTLTNGGVVAGGDISIVATDSLIVSNVQLQAGRSLSLIATNVLTDTGVTNGSVWTVQSMTGVGGVGLNFPVKPVTGDLLGTTVTNYCAGPSSFEANTWPGLNYGATPSGYTNNLALGRLILDLGGANSRITFTGATAGVTNNALYVDYLEFRDYATNGNSTNNFQFPWLTINTNIVIYFAQAVINGQSVAENIDYASRVQGANGGRLLWVPTYAGHYSSTNLVYPAGVTNTFNAALVGSTFIDSDGDGIPNAYDPTPFLTPALVNFTATTTNLPPLSIKIQWSTVANATNYIYYRTNLASGAWLPFTNFNNYYFGNNISVANPLHNNMFVSPQPNHSPATNVWLFEAVTNVPHYYRILVQPSLINQ